MFLEATLTFHGVSNFRHLQPRDHDSIPNHLTRSTSRPTNKQTQKHSLSFTLQHLKGF